MNDLHTHQHHTEETTGKDYLLFAGIILFIVVAAYILPGDLSRMFMATFFLVFGVFKLLDLKGFVRSYIGYDIIAKRFTGYAYAYPFIELALAAGYFLSVPYVDYVTVIIMAVGAIGVARELLRGSKIKCACLGTYVKLPLTTVSLIENLAMGAMAFLAIMK